MTALEVFGYLTDGTFVTVAAVVVAFGAALVWVNQIGGPRR